MNHKVLVERAIAEGFRVTISRGGPKPILKDSRRTAVVLSTIEDLGHCELVFHDRRRKYEPTFWALVDVRGSKGDPARTLVDHDSTVFLPKLEELAANRWRFLHGLMPAEEWSEHVSS